MIKVKGDSAAIKQDPATGTWGHFWALSLFYFSKFSCQETECVLQFFSRLWEPNDQQSSCMSHFSAAASLRMISLGHYSLFISLDLHFTGWLEVSHCGWPVMEGMERPREKPEEDSSPWISPLDNDGVSRSLQFPCSLSHMQPASQCLLAWS